MRRAFSLVAALSILLLVAVLMGSANSADEQSADEEILVPSIVSLIANPQDFDDRWVVVYGVVRSHPPSGWAVYLGSDDAARSIYVNGIWLEEDDESKAALALVDGQWATVRGLFDKDNNGHLGGYAGGIGSIDRVVPIDGS